MQSYRINIEKVLENSLLPQQFAVDNHGELHVQNAAVVDGQAKHNANERELALGFKRQGVEPELPGLLIVCEHTCKKPSFSLLFTKS